MEGPVFDRLGLVCLRWSEIVGDKGNGACEQKYCECCHKLPLFLHAMFASFFTNWDLEQAK